MPLPPQLTLLRPLYLLSLSAIYIPITLFHLLFPPQPSKLSSWSAFQHAWFSHFWSYFGPLSTEVCKSVVEPLVIANVHGVVLDIGPGSGEWVHLYARTKQPVTKVWGVEPNEGHHAALRQRVRDAGLEGVYEILGVGAQDLGATGLEVQSVDTVVTVQTLCSVPEPESIVKSLYPFLKKGGTWVVFEHVKTKYQNEFVGYWQAAIDKIWPTFFGGCSITRPTDELLLQAGEWETVTVKPCKDEGRYDTIPHVFGVLVKR